MEKLSPQVALPMIKGRLQQGKPCPLVVTGTSMVPFLREEKDTVILTAFSGSAAVGDILFYLRRPNAPVLHRVHGLQSDGTLLLCGDNQLELERIRPDQVLAVVQMVNRRGHLIDCASSGWKRLSLLWIRLLPVRRPLLWIIHRLGACKAQLKKN